MLKANFLQNFEVLEATGKSLEFANLVFMLNFEEESTTPENMLKFYEVFKAKSIGFDLGIVSLSYSLSSFRIE